MTQPKIFAVKFNNEIRCQKKTVTAQETVTITFDDAPAEHTLELILFSSQNSECSLTVGHFKINRYDCLDSKIYQLFCADSSFKGVMTGNQKISLLFSTPLLSWLQKNKAY